MEIEPNFAQDAAAAQIDATAPEDARMELAMLLQNPALAQAAAASPVAAVTPVDGVVTLPANVSLDAIKVVGADLVITLPDGEKLVIHDGAIYVPQLVIGGVELPPQNLAALLIGAEVRPAAGVEIAPPPSSSGGNFAIPVGGLGDGLAIGDLLPPTDLAFGQPQAEELFPAVEDSEPTVTIITPENPGGLVDAVTNVAESGLPARNGESPGSSAAGNAETTSGSIDYVAADAPATITINGTVIDTVGQTVTTATGILTVTGVQPGTIAYSYTLTDNTSGDTTTDNFTVVVTDSNGDAAQATLTVNIADDVPTAVNDVIAQPVENQPIAINAFANDTFGADGVNIHNNPVAVTFSQGAAGGGVAYNATTGLFTYTPTAGQQGSDSFTYTITDGDGDSSTATVTLNLLPDSAPVIAPISATVFEAGLPNGSDATANSETTAGALPIITGGDTLASLVIGGVDVTAGGTVTGASGVLTVTHIDGAYAYSYTLTTPTAGDATNDPFAIVATDSDGSVTTSTLTVAIVDDTPFARPDIDSITAATGSSVDLNSDAFWATVTPGSSVAVSPGLTIEATGGVFERYLGVSIHSPSDDNGFTREIDAYNDTPESLHLTFDTGQSEVVLTLNQLYQEKLFQKNAVDPEKVTITLDFSDGTTSTLTVQGVATSEPGLLTVTLASADFGGRAISGITLAPDPSPPNLTGISQDLRQSYNATHPYSEFTLRGVAHTEATSFADGNVLTGSGGTDGNASDGVADIQGADGAVVTGVVAGVAPAASGNVGTALAGSYGTLLLGADGHYNYALNNGLPVVHGLAPGQTLTETFTYTITDGDGDTSTTTLTITINGAGTVAPAAAEAAATGDGLAAIPLGLARVADTGAGIASALLTASVAAASATTTAETSHPATTPAEGDSVVHAQAVAIESVPADDAAHATLTPAIEPAAAQPAHVDSHLVQDSLPLAGVEAHVASIDATPAAESSAADADQSAASQAAHPLVDMGAIPPIAVPAAANDAAPPVDPARLAAVIADALHGGAVPEHDIGALLAALPETPANDPATSPATPALPALADAGDTHAAAFATSHPAFDMVDMAAMAHHAVAAAHP